MGQSNILLNTSTTNTTISTAINNITTYVNKNAGTLFEGTRNPWRVP